MMTRNVPPDSCPAFQKKTKTFPDQPGGVLQVQLLPTQQLQLPPRCPLQLHLVPAIIALMVNKRQARFLLGKTWREHGTLKTASCRQDTNVPQGYGFVEQTRIHSQDWDLMSYKDIFPPLPCWNLGALFMAYQGKLCDYGTDRENKLAECSNSTLFWVQVQVYILVPSSFRKTHEKGRKLATMAFDYRVHCVPIF